MGYINKGFLYSHSEEHTHVYINKSNSGSICWLGQENYNKERQIRKGNQIRSETLVDKLNQGKANPGSFSWQATSLKHQSKNMLGHIHAAYYGPYI